MEFKVGDRVKGRTGIPRIGGKIGTVMDVTSAGYDYGIQFDDPVEDGHCFGNLLKYKKYKSGHCRWVNDPEIEPLPYFAGARVGDSVYSTTYGDGTIMLVNKVDIYPLKVTFQSSYTLFYTLEGYSINLIPIQSLFYSKPVFDLPPPPKRMVKKVIEGWVNLYDENLGRVEVGLLYPTRAAADFAKRPSRLGEACFIPHEYEVEE
ncbi:MAG: hypothetical protein AAB922_04765 [Patescibacteria group bacterium]